MNLSGSHPDYENASLLTCQKNWSPQWHPPSATPRRVSRRADRL